MKLLVHVSFLATVLLLLSGCRFFDNKRTQKHTGLVVVNVLDKDLFEDCHIKGSINIPFETIEICNDIIDKNAEIVFYCSNYFCMASSQACKMARSMGFSSVYAYEGGIAEWYLNGLPVEGPAKSSYLKKHVEQLGNHDPDVALITMNDLAIKMGVQPKN